MEKSDAELITASVREPETFGTIFDRHADAVSRFFVRRIGPDEAPSLTGDVFRIAFERRGDFDSNHTNSLPWLYGIAANRLRNHRREQSRRLQACLQLAVASQASATQRDDALEAHIVLPRLAAAIESLPDGEREALLLFALEELGYADIAATLHIPLGTVRSRINRARTRLRAAVDGDSDE